MAFKRLVVTFFSQSRRFESGNCLQFVYSFSNGKSDCPRRTNRLKLYNMASYGNLAIARLFVPPASHAGVFSSVNWGHSGLASNKDKVKGSTPSGHENFGRGYHEVFS
jgi:hypothetical protein